MKKPKSVQQFLNELESFKSETNKLREVVASIGLEECIKWAMPVYVFKKKNVVGIFASRNYFGLWFYQGALLKDEANVLVNAQEGKTKALRQWRMTKKSEIKVRLIRQYVAEAMGLVDQGAEIKPDRNKPIVIPVELAKALAKNKKAKTAFDALSKSYRREYTDYISEAKRDSTKVKRIEKIIPMICESVGLNDKYRKR